MILNRFGAGGGC